ncbi:MAG TPA: SDR family oxidoreductase, partial [Thermoanaerobaculia bacterium]|nr:SDR family oxidoreductase [Thermoanaerobaculia bacterium]
GLEQAAWEELAAAVDTGFHCDQREVFDQDLELAREANLRPLDNWLLLLCSNPALRLHHLSTALVGGTRRGLLTEFDLDCGQGFHNAWERSKLEAEARLRESPAGDRVTIYRPSHTLGRAAGGEAFELGGAFPLLAVLAAAPVLPGDPRARLDLVPADYVAAAMVALAAMGASGTFHLVGGWDRSLTVRQAAALAAAGRGRSRGGLLLPRALAWPLRLAGAAVPKGFVSRRLAFAIARDWLHQGPVFDNFRADAALRPLGIAAPAPRSWLETAVRAAEARRWPAPAADARVAAAAAGEADVSDEPPSAAADALNAPPAAALGRAAAAAAREAKTT